jgi:hypothetical protein
MIAKAKTLAADPLALSAVRGRLRQRFLASPVCDVAGFARDFYRILRAEWAALCARQPT